jgi:putative aldouronate transport system permease protein
MMAKNPKPLPVRRSLASQLLENRTAYLMILPVVVMFIIFNYLPMAGIQIAFKNYRSTQSMWKAAFVGLKWFRQYFESRYFLTTVRNTLSLAFLSVVIGFPMPIILAVVINEVRTSKLRRPVQTISYMPYFVSTAISVSMMRTIFASNGAINGFITQFTGGQAILFFQDPGWFRFLYIIMIVWQGTGFGSIVYLGALSAIDMELHEAAFIDGAGRLGRIWHISIKGILPTVGMMFIMRMGGLLSIAWMEVLLLQSDLTIDSSEVIQTYLYKRGLVEANFSLGAAIGLLMSVIGLILLLVTNQISRKLSDNEIYMV